jgi:hypothetical protein
MRCLAARLHQAPQRDGVLAQLGLDQVVELGAVHGVPRVRVQHLRHQPVLLDQVVHHIPLAAIADGVGEHSLHQPALQVLVGQVDDVLQEVVGLLELVPEEQVGLRQFKGF